MALIGLSEQTIISDFIHPLFTRLLMLRPMILLTFNAAIFYEVAGAFLEVYFVDFCFAAVSTHFVGRYLIFYLLFAVHDYDNY